MESERRRQPSACPSSSGTYYKSPGDPFAKIRNLFDDATVSPLTRFFFYRAAVQHDSDAIADHLKRGHVVVDRYIHTTIAYHVAMDPRVSTYASTAGLLLPNYTFLLTADEDTLRKRLGSRKDLTRFERNLEFQRRSQEQFLAQGHPVVDTTNTTSTEAARIILEQIQSSP